LLFLLINESCYASEVQKALGIPLTPLQSILRKLEKAGVLISEVQRKTKLYRFNPAYPLLGELKSLLKKGFILLPVEAKRALFSRKMHWRNSLKDHYAHQKRITLCLDAFWKRLAKVQRVSIQSQTVGQAFGDVQVSEKNKDSIIFMESGHWADQNPQIINFSNTIRWSIDHEAGMIALEHLRYGMDRPVFLFHLTPTGPNTLQSIDSHLCSDDCYFGRIEFTKQHIRFLWRALGPSKNEILHHTYS